MNGTTIYLIVQVRYLVVVNHPSFLSLTVLIMNRLYMSSPCSHLGGSVHHFWFRLQKYSSADPIASSLIFYLTALHTAFPVIFLKIKI